MKIQVTDKIIRASQLLVKRNGNVAASHCPLALALNQQTDRTWFIGRSRRDVLKALSWGKDGFNVTLGDKTNRFEKRLANGEKVKPFLFDFPDAAGKIMVATDKDGKMYLSAPKCKRYLHA